MGKRWRRFLWLLVAGLVLGLTGLGAARWYRARQPEYMLRRGQEALRQADYNTARAMAGRLESAGYMDQAHLLQAAINLDLEFPNEAVVAFNQIVATEPRVEAAILYGEWLVRHRTQPAEAERLLRFVLSERPDDLVAHRGLAAIYYDQGAWMLALLHLLRWAELDPHDGRAFRFMGLIYKDMDQPASAIPCYREALLRELTPAVTQEVREELAECLTTQSLYAEALDLLQSCGPRAEQVPQLLAFRSECLAGVSRDTEAEVLLDQSLRRFPHSTELLRLRGKFLATAGKPEEAAPLFERILRQDPHDVTSRYQLAQAYERLQRTEEAAEQRRLLEQTRQGMLALTNLIQEVGEKPWDTTLQQRLAEKCNEMGRPDLARRWLRAATNAPVPGP